MIKGISGFIRTILLWTDGKPISSLSSARKPAKLYGRWVPYYDYTPEKDLGWIIGQHHAHMIPQGLPGEGNILVYDNGGWAGYGSANPSKPSGCQECLRDYSRVLEFDPVP